MLFNYLTKEHLGISNIFYIYRVKGVTNVVEFQSTRVQIEFS